MTLSQIADQVAGTVRLGDALGKSDEQIHEDVHALVGHLPPSEIDAVTRIVTADAAPMR